MASKFRWTGAHWRPEAVRKRNLECLPLADALALCRTEAEVRELAEARGYKPGFVWHVMRARKAEADVDDGIPPWVVE